jgi:hypothetical protein
MVIHFSTNLGRWNKTLLHIPLPSGFRFHLHPSSSSPCWALHLHGPCHLLSWLHLWLNSSYGLNTWLSHEKLIHPMLSLNDQNLMVLSLWWFGHKLSIMKMVGRGLGDGTRTPTCTWEMRARGLSTELPNKEIGLCEWLQRGLVESTSFSIP